MWNKKLKNDEIVITEKSIVKAFLADVTSLEKVESDNPIVLFQDVAKKEAKMIVPVNIDKINLVLKQAISIV